MSALPAGGFSGAISLPLLPDLIQIYTISMADGALTIGSGTRSGTIWFERGSMVHAVCGETIGEEAVYQLIQWHDGRFSLDKDARAPFHSIQTSWQEVLMEGCRRLDEAALIEVPEHDPDDSDNPLDALCARIQRYLSGFLAVAILDSRDGSLLAQRGEEISLRSAGPLIAELLNQQSKVMNSLGRPASLLDSFTTFGNQVHLLEVLPENRLLYLAVTRDGANLAVVRRAVDHAFAKS